MTTPGPLDGLLVVDLSTTPAGAHVGQLFAEVFVLIGLLFGLLAVAARNDSGHLAHLFAELGHVGELVKVAHAKIGNPLIHFGLQGPHGLLVVKRHHSLFLESIVIVTGPSFTRATIISAPNTPDFTGKLALFQSTSRKSSYSGTEIRECAALK